MKKLTIVCLIAAALSSCCGKSVEKVHLVPYPQNVEIAHGVFDIEDADIRYFKGADEQIVALAERLGAQLTLVSGEERVVKAGKGCGSINLIYDKNLACEAYELKVGRCSVNIRASSLNGFNWGVQTLKQLMPVQVYGNDKYSVFQLGNDRIYPVMPAGSTVTANPHPPRSQIHIIIRHDHF